MGSEPTIPIFERAKTVHVFDRVATVTGFYFISLFKTSDVTIIPGRLYALPGYSLPTNLPVT
jgi:hypothetical protein